MFSHEGALVLLPNQKADLLFPPSFLPSRDHCLGCLIAIHPGLNFHGENGVKMVSGVVGEVGCVSVYRSILVAEVPSGWDPPGQVVGGLSLVFPSSKIILEPAISSPFLSWFRTLCFFTWASYSQQPPSL